LVEIFGVSMKKILATRERPGAHWVGNGFPVRSLFSYHSAESDISPFLLLDHAGPYEFEPLSSGELRRGVGEHPHRGFETVTIVYAGEVEHRDSTGAGGLIGPGDVQWMTAGAGVLHEEFHSDAFMRKGGSLEMVQLWVNLPARFKMVQPRYQTLESCTIPVVKLADDMGTLRVIAGQYGDTVGPAATYSALDVWDIKTSADSAIALDMSSGRTTILVVLQGTLNINSEARVNSGEIAFLSAEGSFLEIICTDPARYLVLSGEPIDEPIVGYGPFVMNSAEQINQAMNDFHSGKFGRMPSL
jgi:redox-sensitive bicupin YhaK (pirin superfamily)